MKIFKQEKGLGLDLNTIDILIGRGRFVMEKW